MKYYVLCKEDDYSLQVKNEVIDALNKYNYEFDEENPQIVIFVGGDGAFLTAVHKYMHIIHKVKFIGVRTGNLGYFCEYEPKEVERLAKDLVASVPLEYEYNLLEATLSFNDDKEACCLYSVNEIRIESPFNTLVSNVYINDQLLEEFRGSGLLVSSSLGSTGYNKSINGAVIDNSINVLELSEINGINNKFYRSLQSPLILNEKTKISFKGNFDKIVLGYDNKIFAGKNIKDIDIISSDATVTLLRFKPFDFVGKIKKCFIKE